MYETLIENQLNKSIELTQSVRKYTVFLVVIYFYN